MHLLLAILYLFQCGAGEIYTLLSSIIMSALCNRTGHYIFALWFLLSIYVLFSSPNLSSRRGDAYHTSAHGVALVPI